MRPSGGSPRRRFSSDAAKKSPEDWTMTSAALNSSVGLMRAVSAGVDPVGFFGRRATQQSPFVLYFPELGDVVFVCTKEGVRDILTAPAALCRAPTPNPIEAVVDVGSLI
jgi:cytochrome P450 family 110